MGERNKESTWSTCCVLLSELVSLLQLVKPPLIDVLKGHAPLFLMIKDELAYRKRFLATTLARGVMELWKRKRAQKIGGHYTTGSHLKRP